MAALDTLIVEVQAQTGNLKSQLNDVAQSIEKVGTAAKVEGTKVGAFGEQMKKGLHTAGLALGMLGLVHVLKESTKVAAEDATSKALLAREIHDELLQRYPNLRHHTVVGLPMAGTFHGTSGLQVWYHDTTIYCQPLSW